MSVLFGEPAEQFSAATDSFVPELLPGVKAEFVCSAWKGNTVGTTRPEKSRENTMRSCKDSIRRGEDWLSQGEDGSQRHGNHVPRRKEILLF